MLRPQDTLILLKVMLSRPNWRQLDIAKAVGVSPAELHLSLKRSTLARLFQPDTRRVQKNNLLEFVVHGLKYLLPAELGATSRGIPTAWSAPPLNSKIISGSDDSVVWPSGEGTVRGAALLPIYESAPAAALLDPRLYELLALIDALRIGRARERELAVKELTRRFE